MPEEVSDAELIEAMLGADLAVAQVARSIFVKRHPDYASEPPHCSECFEGCEKCQGNRNAD